MSDVEPITTVRDLRRHWKPTKEKLQRASSQHPLAIRMHRAFSWMAAVESYGERESLDQQLIFRWIALNALYGRWNGENKEPESDNQSLKRFLSVIEDIDQSSLMRNCLSQNKPLVITICSDPFVNDYFWRVLDSDKRFNAKRDKFSIERMYVEEKWSQIIDELIERIYLVRCQLVHGASTHESSLNRDTVRRCGIMMNHFLVCITTIITEHGVAENWDDLCYPPVNASQLGPANPR